MDAKSKGGNVKMRPGWNNMKVDVMLTVVRSKFSRDEDLQRKLLATKDQKIVEGHTGDKFWGGKANHLGNILMRLREEFQACTSKTVQAPVFEELDAVQLHRKQDKGNNCVVTVKRGEEFQACTSKTVQAP